MKKLIYRLSVLPLLLSLILAGCVDDTFNSGSAGGENGTELILQVKAPRMQNGISRAMSAADESAVKDLKVLVFDGADETGTYNDLDEKFAYVAAVLETQENTPSVGITTVKVKVSADAGKKKRLVFIANHPNSGSITTAALSGKTKEEIFASMSRDYTDKWAATEGVSTIPMWGESNLTTIRQTNTRFTDFTGASDQVRLHRSLARVDVGVNFIGDDKSETVQPLAGLNFKIASISVYRTAASFLIPGTQASVTARTPNLPQSVAYRADDRPLTYTVGSAGGADGYIREIYIPERALEGTRTNDNVPCIVIGAYYGENNTDKITYYRADFAMVNNDGSANYLNILRNHRYRFNITTVKGEGFPTEEIALKSKPENLQYTVMVWNESVVSNVTTDGQYMLGVDKDSLTYYRYGGKQNLIVRTDYPDGWTAKVTEGSEWLSIGVNNGVANKDVELPVQTVENTTETNRVGKILVTAGRMSWEVKVTQLPYSQLAISLYKEDGVTPLTMLEFGGKGGTKQVVVKYEPSIGTLTYQELKENNDNTFAWEQDVQKSSPGMAVYNVTAPAIGTLDAFGKTANQTVVFNVENEGQDEAKALVLVQKDYNAVPFADSRLQESMLGETSAFYVMDGAEKKFYVKANTPYKLELISNSADAGAGGTGTLIPGGLEISKPGKMTGESIAFTPANDLKDQTRLMGYATFKLSSPEGLFDDKEFTVLLGSGKTQPEANCYLMKPGKTGILIPVSRINTAKAFYDLNEPQLKDDAATYKLNPTDWDARLKLPALATGTNWTPDVLWADVSNTYSGAVVQPKNGKTGLLREVGKVTLDGKEYVYVFPGQNTGNLGNVLVSLKENNKILWSWHLWIVSDYPFDGSTFSGNGYTKTILNRDLGALRPNLNRDYARAEDLALHGMLYQWGRKDPFVVVTSSNTTRKLIDKDGTAFTYAQQSIPIGQQSGFFSMRESIENPFTMVGSPMTETPGNWPYEAGTANQGEAVWYNLWGGEIVDDNRSNYTTPTDKTVFDPSPYGWKIPNCGDESAWKGYGPYLTKGCFYYQNGFIRRCTWTSFESFRFTSCVYTSSTASGYISGSGGAANANTAHSRTWGMLVRSVANEKETDFRSYLP